MTGPQGRRMLAFLETLCRSSAARSGCRRPWVDPTATYEDTLVRSNRALEDDLRWLISVGVLRREVDEQVDQPPSSPPGSPTPRRRPHLQRPMSMLDQLRHSLRRHWPL